MFSVGLDLDRKRLGALARRPVLLFFALALNFIVVPLAAYGLVTGFALAAPIAAGLILVAIAPGGGTGTLMTQIARADLELSVLMLVPLTALSTFFTPLLAEALVSVGAGAIDRSAMLKTLLLFQLAPLLLGFSARLFWPSLADRLTKGASTLANILFATLVIGLLILHGPKLAQVGAGGLVAVGLLAMGSVALGFLLPLPRSQRYAVGLTTGTRNVALSILIASSFFPNPLTLMAVLAYGLGQYLICVPVALFARRRTPDGTTV